MDAAYCDVLTEFGSSTGVAAEGGRRWGARRRVAMGRVKTRVCTCGMRKSSDKTKNTSSSKRKLYKFVFRWGGRYASRGVSVPGRPMSASPPGPGRTAQGWAASSLQPAHATSSGGTSNGGTSSDGIPDSISHHAGAASGHVFRKTNFHPLAAAAASKLTFHVSCQRTHASVPDIR